MVLGGVWWLFSGLVLGDMGGIVGLGVTPDLPIIAFDLLPATPRITNCVEIVRFQAAIGDSG